MFTFLHYLKKTQNFQSTAKTSQLEIRKMSTMTFFDQGKKKLFHFKTTKFNDLTPPFSHYADNFSKNATECG